ncbi:unnamed protein product [Choristocarpus tenellus]
MGRKRGSEKVSDPDSLVTDLAIDTHESRLWCGLDWIAPLIQVLLSVERASCLLQLSIIARKRLDINFLELARAARLSLTSLFLDRGTDNARDEAMTVLDEAWKSALTGRNAFVMPSSRGGSNDALPVALSIERRECDAAIAPFLSVRTSFDLYLKALALPPGSRVVCSALTIPDMVYIMQEHGLLPAPVDMDPDTLAPMPGAIEAEIIRLKNVSGGLGDGENGKISCNECRPVRAIYIAHVFGAQVDMEPVAEVAARHGLLVWEDCAQVFTGLHGYLGHPSSDIAFFSFGVIKRATALGGGVVRTRDPSVLKAMCALEATYPVQSSLAYLRRVAKCTLLLTCTTPLVFGILVHALGLIGVDHDKVVMKLSHGFPKKGMLEAIRHRSSLPLLQMLARRISMYTSDGVEVRLRLCNRMLIMLGRALHPNFLEAGAGAGAKGVPGGVGALLPGTKAHRHTLWLYPVVIPKGGSNVDRVVEALLHEGFDATRAPTSLVPIDRCLSLSSSQHTNGTSEVEGGESSPVLTRCCKMMDSLVYLPLLNNIPDSEWDRMAFVLARALSDTTDGSRVLVPSSLSTGNNKLSAASRGAGRVSFINVASLLRLDVAIGILVVLPLVAFVWLALP